MNFISFKLRCIPTNLLLQLLSLLNQYFISTSRFLYLLHLKFYLKQKLYIASYLSSISTNELKRGKTTSVHNKKLESYCPERGKNYFCQLREQKYSKKSKHGLIFFSLILWTAQRYKSRCEGCGWKGYYSAANIVLLIIRTFIVLTMGYSDVPCYRTVNNMYSRLVYYLDAKFSSVIFESCPVTNQKETFRN